MFLTIAAFYESPCSAEERFAEVFRVRTATGEFAAKVVEREQGIVLLERRNGQLLMVKEALLQQSEPASEEWRSATADEIAAELIERCGAGFEIRQTKHFVICSDASLRYTEFVGRLLEKVHSEFIRFMNVGAGPAFEAPSHLPVVVFGRNEAFRVYASRQHPETDFSDTPGYYSLRDNQMLISGLSGDQQFRTNGDVVRELRKSPRQVETIVHEAVHQIAFNSGVQKRYADNPTWLSEGLAVYFEQSTGTGSLLWSRPGKVSRIHFPTIQRAESSGKLEVRLDRLLGTDDAFQSADDVAAAYATSWALTHYLIRSDRSTFDTIIRQFGSERQLVKLGAARRIEIVTEATNKSVEELSEDLLRYIARLRLN